MGLFGSKKKTYVSSVAYNLAGDIKLRPNYIRQIIIGYVFSPQDGPSYGETLNRALLTGSGIRMRTFGTWAKTQGYKDLIGQEEGQITVNMRIDAGILGQEIPHGEGESVLIQNTQIDFADYMVWANKFMLDNYPELFDTEWQADYKELEGELIITFEDGSTVVSPINDFDPRSKYIYATYLIVSDDIEGELNVGLDMVLPDGTPFPDMKSWTLVSNETEYRTITLNNKTVLTTTQNTPVPGEPNEVIDVVESTTEVPYTYSKKVYELIQFVGSNPNKPDEFMSIKYTSTHISEAVAVPVIERKEETFFEGEPRGWTTVTETNRERIGYKNWYREDHRDISQLSYSTNKVFIYKEGSGKPRLDVFFTQDKDGGSFFPFIPVRYYNQFLSDNYYGDVYKKNPQALLKAINAKYDDVVDSVSQNDSLGDIDHAFITFGASLNTPDTAARKYLYQFFKTMLDQYSIPTNTYVSWADRWDEADASQRAYINWLLTESNKPVDWTRPKPTPPKVIPYPTPPNYNIRIVSNKFSYDMMIYWLDMKEVTGTGKRKPDAKVGEVWITKDGAKTFYSSMYASGWDDHPAKMVQFPQHTTETITINYQETATKWKAITIWGLNHKNVVYGGKAVNISPYEALDDTEESGFIVPLHEEVLKKLSLLDASQLTTACSYMVFNCYQVVKKKWYQTGFFKIAFIVVVVAITIYSGGAAGAGLLGTNAAVGATIGFSGLAAVIAGGIANAVAAAIVTQVISTISVSILGDKIGYIVAAIASVVAISVGTSMFNGGTALEGFNNLLGGMQLFNLTVATMNGVQQTIAAGTADYQRQSQRLLQDYKEESSIIENAYSDLFGSADANSWLSNFMLNNPKVFLARTLMTGDDIAEANYAMIENFYNMTLKLPLE